MGGAYDERTKRIERIERTQWLERFKRTERPERIEWFERPERSERIERRRRFLLRRRCHDRPADDARRHRRPLAGSHRVSRRIHPGESEEPRASGHARKGNHHRFRDVLAPRVRAAAERRLQPGGHEGLSHGPHRYGRREPAGHRNATRSRRSHGRRATSSSISCHSSTPMPNCGRTGLPRSSRNSKCRCPCSARSRSSTPRECRGRWS